MMVWWGCSKKYTLRNVGNLISVLNRSYAKQIIFSSNLTKFCFKHQFVMVRGLTLL